MNLLGAILYDPTTAGAKATSSLLAMTAVDTTNLRLTVTVPAHGLVRCKMMCAIEGATTFPQILLGVLVGAAVKGRITPEITINGTALATTRAVAVAEFTMTGLAAGSTVFDAAYGVEIVVASTNIKYGGPDNTTTDDAWGGFLFELWDPRPLPLTVPGGNGGLLLSGTNTGPMSISGGVSFTNSAGDAFTITSSGSNGNGINISANGSGAGILLTPGATGHGLQAKGGATSGDAINAVATTSGNGIVATGTGTTKHGIVATGGATTSDGIRAAGGGAGHGINAIAGATGIGLKLAGGATSGNGLDITTTSGHGISSVATGTTKHGIVATGGATTSHGISATGGGVGHGILATSGSGSTGDGIRATSASTNGNGIGAFGKGSGPGLSLGGGLTGDGLDISGGGTSGFGIFISTTIGHGISIAASGTDSHGFFSTGGTGGVSDGMKLVAGTGGVDLRANLTGNITGTLSTVTTLTNLPAITANWLTAAGINAGALNGKGDWLLASSYTAPLSAAATATAVWTDTTASDFTTALSIGKSVMNGVTLGTGLTINAYTGNTPQTGDSFARIGAAGVGLTAVGLTGTQIFNNTGTWTGNITGSVGSVTAAVTLSAGDSPVLQSGTASAGGASTITIQTALGADSLPVGCTIKITSGTGAKQARVITGYVDSTKVVTVDRAWTTNPDNTSVYSILYTELAALGASLKISGVVLTDTLTTYTGNTPQTGDSFSRIGVAGVGLTNLGDSRIANLDATVSSRMATYTQPTGFLAATFPSGTVANTTNITAGIITTVTNLTNAATNGDLTATMKTSVQTAADAAITANVTIIEINADVDEIITTIAVIQAKTDQLLFTANGNVKSSMVEILTTALTEGAAGRLAGGFKQFFNIASPAATMDHLILVDTATNLTNAPTVGDFTAAMKTSIQVAADAAITANITIIEINADVDEIITTIGVAGVGLTNLGDARIANLDATVSSRLAAASYDSPVLQTGTASAGGASTITIQTALGADSLPNGCTIKITSGTGAKQARVIKGYVDSTKVVTVDNAWTTNPDNTSVYVILYGEAAALSAGLKVTEVVLTDTATNLTNAPTNGDLTATMKTSVQTAADAAITGNATIIEINADVDEIIVSIAALPTPLDAAGTRAAIGLASANLDTQLAEIGADVDELIVGVTVAGYAAGQDPATLVLDVASSSHNIPGTIGEDINNAGTAGDPWATSLPGAYGAGTAGFIVGNELDAAVSSRAPASTALSTTQWTNGRAADLDNLDVAVSSRLATASYTAPLDAAGTRAAVGLASANLDTQLNEINADTDELITTIGVAGAGLTNLGGVDVIKINGDANSAANLAKSTRAIGRGTVNGSSSLTHVVSSAFLPLGVDADQFSDRVILFDADTVTPGLRGQAVTIVANTAAAAPDFTVTPLTTAPAPGDTFSVI